MAKKPAKYIFVTGGVLSGLGKGITAASIGNLLKSRGLKVNLQKCDPYLNFDAGTLNPAEHGECFVTADGAETDLDLGHYERFIDQELTSSSSLMSGQVLMKVLDGERNGKYLGKTVQFIPHVIQAFQEEIAAAGKGYDVHIVEIGGTVGDYESISTIESIREMGFSAGDGNALFVHVVYMPYLGASKEVKTKPAQNAVRELRGYGISPDILVARSEVPPGDSVHDKLSLYTGVSKEAIALLPNANSIYEVPLTLEEEGLSKVICRRLNLKTKSPKLKNWRRTVELATTRFDQKVTIGVVAKYLTNHDTYLSVFEALRAAAWKNKVNLDIKWIDAEAIEAGTLKPASAFKKVDGIVVPGGFGRRGLEGKIIAAQYSLKHKVPYLGLCLGLQMAVVAAARNGGLKTATTFELDSKAADKVIDTMSDQVGKENTGGTMRLGNYDCQLTKGSLAYKLYKKLKITERHRHRGECSNDYLDHYKKWGIKASGINKDNNLVEIIEGTNHTFFVASQFHPEFKSRPNRPHPLFDGYIAAIKNLAKTK